MAAETKQNTRRGSIAVVVVLLVLALAAAVAASALQPSAPSGGLVAKVTIHGEVVDLLPLTTDIRQVYSTEDGTNTVVIQDGAVHIEDADCAGGDCMKQGTIAEAGRLLVCLPHQLIVEIVPADGTDVPSVYTGDEVVGGEGSSNIDVVTR